MRGRRCLSPVAGNTEEPLMLSHVAPTHVTYKVPHAQKRGKQERRLHLPDLQETINLQSCFKGMKLPDPHLPFVFFPKTGLGERHHLPFPSLPLYKRADLTHPEPWMMLKPPCHLIKGQFKYQCPPVSLSQAVWWGFLLLLISDKGERWH